MAKSASERFWARVDKSGDCWLWLGERTKPADEDGYGRIRAPQGRIVAHRFAYEEKHGPVPAGMVLDHLCRTRLCVNPDHLEPVTAYVNMMRGAGFPARQLAQTHCLRGHPLAGDNLRLVNGGKSRCCRACRRMLENARRERLRKE